MSQNLRKVMLSKYFPDKRGGFFIEAGAYDGGRSSVCRPLEYDFGWTGINVEPNPHCFAQLVANRPNCTNINAALSDKSGTAKFTVHLTQRKGRRAQGSLKHLPEHLEQLKKLSGNKFEEFEVRTMTFKQLVEGVKKIDMFVLDVEGYELQVIDSMHSCSVLPSVMFVEDDHLPSSELMDRMEVLGYHQDGRDDHNIFFVRKNT